MPHRWYYVDTKITPVSITVYHINYRKSLFCLFAIRCNWKCIKTHELVRVNIGLCKIKGLWLSNVIFQFLNLFLFIYNCGEAAPEEIPQTQWKESYLRSNVVLYSQQLLPNALACSFCHTWVIIETCAIRGKVLQIGQKQLSNRETKLCQDCLAVL
jgi:hypothetical protein